MNRNEQEYYRNIARVARSIEDIVITLEKLVRVQNSENYIIDFENEKKVKNKNQRI